MEHISSEFISVVIQGLLFRDGNAQEQGDLLMRTVHSIRHYLPKAEIIVSTWEHQYTDDLDNLRVIKTQEPEAFLDCTGDLNNINRQLLNTQLGIKAATRPYVLKFRADHYLTGTAITQMASLAPDSPHRFLSAPITITNRFVRNPLKLPFLFHISDLIMFGRKKDLLDIWQQPPVDFAQLQMTQKEQFRILGNYRSRTMMRHIPEQSLTLGWLNKHNITINLPYCTYTSWPLFELWEQVLLSNFHIIDYESSGIHFPQRFLRALYGKSTLYQPSDLMEAQKALGNWRHKLRYFKLWLNKYCWAWFKKHYLISITSHILFAISPEFEKKTRHSYRKLKGIHRMVSK